MQHTDPQDLLQTIQLQAWYLGISFESFAHALWNLLWPEQRPNDGWTLWEQTLQTLTQDQISKLSDILSFPPPQDIQWLLMWLQTLYGVSRWEITLWTSVSWDIHILSFELQDSSTGRGSYILRYICYYADLYGVSIHLKAGWYPQTDHSRLIQRYLRHGFEFVHDEDSWRSRETCDPMQEIPLVKRARA